MVFHSFLTRNKWLKIVKGNIKYKHKIAFILKRLLLIFVKESNVNLYFYVKILRTRLSIDILGFNIFFSIYFSPLLLWVTLLVIYLKKNKRTIYDWIYIYIDYKTFFPHRNISNCWNVFECDFISFRVSIARRIQ